MKSLMKILTIVLYTIGVLALCNAKTPIHEIESFLIFIIATIIFSSLFIVNTLEKLILYLSLKESIEEDVYTYTDSKIQSKVFSLRFIGITSIFTAFIIYSFPNIKNIKVLKNISKNRIEKSKKSVLNYFNSKTQKPQKKQNVKSYSDTQEIYKENKIKQNGMKVGVYIIKL
ncbi:MAG: hypothetical protein COB02_18605 [Candidatus Cloacimonadota bacterium]|nr:MAG: hypothetical protein COB02_18605 [Candidatus Cloacimonadota bacterium]